MRGALSDPDLAIWSRARVSAPGDHLVALPNRALMEINDQVSRLWVNQQKVEQNPSTREGKAHASPPGTEGFCRIGTVSRVLPNRSHCGEPRALELWGREWAGQMG